MKLLDIAEVAAQSGVSPSALRYYEKSGLIHAVARHGLRRQYAPEVLLQLRLIAMGQTAGFSLQEIGGLFGRGGVSELPRDKLHARADQLDNQILELTALRDTLRHVADCGAPSHFECPNFRRLMEISADQARSARAIKQGKPGRKT